MTGTEDFDGNRIRKIPGATSSSSGRTSRIPCPGSWTSTRRVRGEDRGRSSSPFSPSEGRPLPGGGPPSQSPPPKRLLNQPRVTVRATIDREGNVVVVEVLRGQPYGLSEEAVKAYKQWKFKPATLHGRPVSVYYHLTMNFRLARKS